MTTQELQCTYRYRLMPTKEQELMLVQMCSVCGYKYEQLGRDEREWVCAECGAHHDRDGNAARNICREGLRLLVDSGELVPKSMTSLNNLNDNLRTNSPRDMGRVKTAVERA